jgi:hypothetical protein
MYKSSVNQSTLTYFVVQKKAEKRVLFPILNWLRELWEKKKHGPGYITVKDIYTFQEMREICIIMRTLLQINVIKSHLSM